MFNSVPYASLALRSSQRVGQSERALIMKVQQQPFAGVLQKRCSRMQLY